jgi:hypothetical protein
MEASDRGRRVGELGVQARPVEVLPAWAGGADPLRLPTAGGRPLVRLDNEQGASALSMQVLEELGLRAEVG